MNDLDEAWRTLTDLAYEQRAATRGQGDGMPDERELAERQRPVADRWLTSTQLDRRADALATITAATGVPEWYVRDQVDTAVEREWRSPGADGQPDFLAPPTDWGDFAEDGRDAARQRTERTAGAFSAELARARAALDTIRAQEPDTAEHIADPSLDVEMGMDTGR